MECLNKTARSLPAYHSSCVALRERGVELHEEVRLLEPVVHSFEELLPRDVFVLVLVDHFHDLADVLLRHDHTYKSTERVGE